MSEFGILLMGIGLGWSIQAIICHYNHRPVKENDNDTTQ